MKKLLCLTFLALVLNTGCSTQHREAQPILTDDELNSLLNDMSSQGSLVASAVSGDATAGNNNMVIYHAGSFNGRPAPSVLALTDMGAFDPAAGWESGTWAKDTTLDEVDIVFVENVDDAGNLIYTLGVRMHYADEQAYFYYEAQTSDPSDVIFDDNGFQATLLGPNGTITVTSTDISDKYSDVLADAVKLKIYFDDGSGQRYIGHISTMARY